MKVSAIANLNIALVKYWGKRNKELILPKNSSISVTIEGLFSHTTVEFGEEYKDDIFVLDGKEFKRGSEEYDEYIEKFLDFVRQFSKINFRAKIVSKNNFPPAAGLASSAAGFAALATAINKALNLALSQTELSILARRGSGSATRSIFGGFVEWRKGVKEDGSDSSAVQIVPPDYWPDFRILICLTSKKEKKIKSRAGMEQTVKTSPYYRAWLATVDEDLKKAKKGILEKNFTLVGKTAEENCLKMHATMITTYPPIIYWNEGTIEVIRSVLNWREGGLETYFTIDAGPQVKILCKELDVSEVKKRLKNIKTLKNTILARPGRGARITKRHLF